MIAIAALIVCLSPLSTVLPAADGELPLLRLAEAAASQPAGHATPAPRAEADAERERLWMAPLGSLRKAKVINVGTVGELLLAEDSLGGLTALDPATGQARWFVKLPAPLSAWPVPGDGLLALPCGQDVLVVRSATGTRQHTVATSSVPSGSPTADAQAVYVPTLLGDRLVTTNLANGQVAWSYQMPAPISTPAQLIGQVGNRSILMGCEDGVLRALPTGLAVPTAERWAARVGSIIDRPVIAGQRVFVAGRDRVLTALDVASGAVLWKHLPGEPLRGAPVVVGDLVVASTGKRLFAVQAADGKLAWEQELDARPLSELNGAVLVKRANGSTERRAAATGKLIGGPLPADVVSTHGMLVELGPGGEISAWKLDR